MKRWVIVCLAAAPLAAQERPPSPVVVAPVVEREVAARRSFVGTVEAARSSTVGSESEGLVVEYLAEEGKRVEQGEPLARLRTRLLEIALDAARAELKLRQEELKELENGARPEELEQAKARYEQAEAAVEIRRWKLSRAQELFATNVISEDEAKDARLVARVAEEVLDEAKAAYSLVKAGPRQEKIAQAAARVQVQEAEVARIQDELDRHTIRAPFDGYVVEEHSEVGQWVKKGDPVCVVAALDEVDIVVPVLEDYAMGLKLGAEVPISVGALPDREFKGRLAAIVPKADPRSRTFPVKVRLKNPAHGDSVLLKAGMFITIHARVGRTEKALVVSKDALVLGGPKPVVYLLDEQTSTVRPVPVDVGTAVDGEVAVRGALAAGQKVVVRGNERLQPGQKVAATEARDG